MKKHLKYILIFLLIFIIPLGVKATDITDKLYINIKIETDGSLFIKEIASLSGKYKGRLRDIQFRNNKAPHFTGVYQDFAGSDIYNGSAITDLKVYDILDTYNFEIPDNIILNREFELVEEANNGDYGVYTKEDTSTGTYLKIFNPSSKKSLFYMEYRVKDAVVVHNDVAELAWNVLGDSYQENINKLLVRIELPKENNNLRVWLHGPLHGTIEHNSNILTTVLYNSLDSYNPVSVRLMFDKGVVPNATKKSNLDGKNIILDYEQKQADIANAKREEEYAKVLQLAKHYLNIAKRDLDIDAYNEALGYINQLNNSADKTEILNTLPEIRALIEPKLVNNAKASLVNVKKHKKEENLNKAEYNISLLLPGEEKERLLVEFNQLEVLVEQHLNMVRIFIYIITGLWFGTVILTICLVKIRYNKKVKSEFTGVYYRDFPADYGPGVLEYLMKKEITTLTFSATILDLIRKKVISFEEIPTTKKKKDYMFKRNSTTLELTMSEEELLTLLFKIVGADNQVTLNQIKDYGSEETRAKTFISYYNKLKDTIKTDAIKENFYTTKTKWKTLEILLILIGGISLLIFSFMYDLFILFIIIIVLIGIGIIYTVKPLFRTAYGKTQYEMWSAHKRFLLDFGRFQEKDLPSVALWERYLVTATVLGCANQVQDSMQIHLTNMDSTVSDSSIYGDMMTIHMMNHLLDANIASVVAETVSSAFNVSNSTIATANSVAASGGGFGGGSSGGGGSFGGGGGGGRF